MKNLKTKIVGTIVILAITAFTFGAIKNDVFAAKSESGCGEITEGTPYYSLNEGVYTDIKTGSKLALAKGIASESTIGLIEGTVDISPRCFSKSEMIKVFSNFMLRDEQGNYHDMESGVGFVLEYGDLPLP